MTALIATLTITVVLAYLRERWVKRHRNSSQFDHGDGYLCEDDHG